MSNAFKKETVETDKKKSGFAPARFIASVLNGDALQSENMFRNLSYMVFLVILLIGYLGYGYYSERSLRELMQTDAKLKEKKAEYVTNKSLLEQKKIAIKNCCFCSSGWIG